MVTHDVDEAILLSDRTLLMTNGLCARIAELVNVAIPRPRARETIIEHPHYYKNSKSRDSVLVRHASHSVSNDGAVVEQQRPLVVWFQ